MLAAKASRCSATAASPTSSGGGGTGSKRPRPGGVAPGTPVGASDDAGGGSGGGGGGGGGVGQRLKIASGPVAPAPLHVSPLPAGARIASGSSIGAAAAAVGVAPLAACRVMPWCQNGFRLLVQHHRPVGYLVPLLPLRVVASPNCPPLRAASRRWMLTPSPVVGWRCSAPARSCCCRQPMP